MEFFEPEKVKKEYPYLANENIESILFNDDTLCITLTTTVKNLKNLINNYGWQCIFNNSLDENTQIFTCIVRSIKK